MNQIESLLRQQEALINQLRDEATKLRNEASNLFDMLGAIVEHADEPLLNNVQFRAFAKSNALDAMKDCTASAWHIPPTIAIDPRALIWMEMPTPPPTFNDGDEFMIFTKEYGTLHCRYRHASPDFLSDFVSIRCDSWENQTVICPSEVLYFIPCNPPITNTQDVKEN